MPFQYNDCLYPKKSYAPRVAPRWGVFLGPSRPCWPDEVPPICRKQLYHRAQGKATENPLPRLVPHMCGLTNVTLSKIRCPECKYSVQNIVKALRYGEFCGWVGSDWVAECTRLLVLGGNVSSVSVDISVHNTKHTLGVFAYPLGLVH